MSARFFAALALVVIAAAVWMAFSNTGVVHEASNEVLRGRSDAVSDAGSSAEAMAELGEPDRNSRESQPQEGSASPVAEEASVPAQVEASQGTPVEEEEAESGTVVRGRILDREGAPLSSARLKLRAPGKRTGMQIRGDDAGRFSVAVDVDGDVLLYAFANGVGQSLEKAVFLPLGQATDVGDLRLESAGSIRGRVELPDQTPLPGVFVSGQAADPLAAPGLRHGSDETEADGSFELLALAPGAFNFTVSMDENLPLIGSAVLQSGDDRGLLVVDAAVVEVYCQGEDGEALPMAKLNLTDVVDGAADEEAVGTTRRSFSPSVERFELILAPRKRYLVQAVAVDGRVYSALLKGDLTAGFHSLPLRLEPPELGAMMLRLSPGSASPGASISLDGIERGGIELHPLLSNGGSEAEGWTLEARGLVPGTYSVRAALEGADWTALKETTHSVEVAPGAVAEVALETLTGGRIRFAVAPENLPLNGPLKTRGTIKLRRAGTLEWHWAELISVRKGTTSRGARVWLDGTVAKSQVLTPGSYQARISAKGYLTAEVDVVVTPEAAAEVSVSLLDK